MTTTLDTDLEVFAAAVRRELHDLGPDVIDELTDGLEADLADSLADGGELGDPVAYAAELRAAAGLDPRGRRTRRPSDLDAAARSAIAELRSEAAGFVARHPAVRGVVDFFVSLRPVWWLLRAWAVGYVLTGSVAPLDPLGVAVHVGLAVVSVQWGRGRWLPWRWSRAGVVVVSVGSLLLLPIAAGTAANIAGQRYEVYTEPMYDGVMLNGQQVMNIFAYGADGEALTDVRLFDQNGEPLSVVPDSWNAEMNHDYSNGEDVIYVPSDEVTGATGWNVYPLKTVTPSAVNEYDGTVKDWASRTDPTAPFRSLQQLLDYEAPEAPATEAAPAAGEN